MYSRANDMLKPGFTLQRKPKGLQFGVLKKQKISEQSCTEKIPCLIGIKF